MELDTSFDDDDVSENVSFDDAFGPLAHHLFPDGAPQEDLYDIWPHRDDRRPIPFKDARLSIKNLVEFSSRHGLNSVEMWAVTFVACATLPLAQQVRVNTPCVDGTSVYFRSILRCLVPKNDAKVLPNLVLKLLGAQCDSHGKRSVLQFFACAVRNGWLDREAEKVLSSLYGVIFSMIFDPLLCSDGVRLSYYITKRSHVRVDRIQRMKHCFEESKKSKGKSPHTPMLLLIHLYARFDPVGCAKYIPVANRVKLASLYRTIILSEKSNTKRTRRRSKKRSKLDTSFPAMAKDWLRDSLEGVISLSWGNDFSQSTWTASNLLTNERLRCLSSVEDYSSADAEIVRLRSSLPFLLFEEWYGSCPRTSSTKKDCDVLDNDEEAESKSVIGKKTLSLDNVLDGRLRLLTSLASFAHHTGSLLPEMEYFLVHEIIPVWDGTDATGRILCYELIPYLSPMPFEALETLLLCRLEPFLFYGGPRIHYLVIAGALASLVRRWGRMDWSHVKTTRGEQRNNIWEKEGQDPNQTAFKQVTLGRLIQWTDRTILKAFLLQKSIHTLLGMAALEFFTAVAKLTNHCPFLIAPSPALVYHLLISPSSAVTVDGICQLLVDYKGSFQQLKALDEFRQHSQPVCGLESIAVFNSFIWDFCNVLWKCTLTWNDDGKDPVVSLLLSHLPHESRECLQREDELASAALSVVQGSLFLGYLDRFWGKVPGVVANSGTPALPLFRQLQGNNMKAKYCDFLREDCGLHGLYAFLTTFVGSLAQREEQRRRDINSS